MCIYIYIYMCVDMCVYMYTYASMRRTVCSKISKCQQRMFRHLCMFMYVYVYAYISVYMTWSERGVNDYRYHSDVSFTTEAPLFGIEMD